jgi:hypothetical protein
LFLKIRREDTIVFENHQTFSSSLSVFDVRICTRGKRFCDIVPNVTFLMSGCC